MEFLIRPVSFFLIILIGFFLKQVGFFQKDHQSFVTRIILNITLPCAAIQAFGTAEKEFTLVTIALLGFLCALIPIPIYYYMTRGLSRDRRSFYMLNASGYSLGCFAMPVIQSFFGATGAMLVCIFDIGNAILNTSGSYVLVSSLLHIDGEKLSRKAMIRRFFSSIAIGTYFVMLILMILNIDVPHIVLTLVEPVANANAFLSMLMLGMMIEIPRGKEYCSDVINLLVSRLIMSAFFSLFFFFCTPFAPEVRQVLAVIPFSPIGIMAPFFTRKCGGNQELSGFANSISDILSLILISVLCTAMLA